jgi:hypothetical protein
MTGKFQVMGKFAKANIGQGLTTVDRNYSQRTSIPKMSHNSARRLLETENRSSEASRSS